MELTRVLLGIVVAVALPLCVPRLRRAPRASIAFSALYALFSVLTAIPWYAAVVAVLGAAGVQFLVHRDAPIPLPAAQGFDLARLKPATLLARLRRPAAARRRSGPPADETTVLSPEERPGAEEARPATGGGSPGEGGSAAEAVRARGRHAGERREGAPGLLDRVRGHVVPLAAVALLAVIALLVEGGQAITDAATGLTDDRVAIAVSAFLLATFVGGAVVARLLAPFTAALAEQGEDMPALRGAGQYIGWFERALLFCFIVGGQPEAAVLVVAAKALARFPELKTHQKGFAEYSLVGTLASLTVALAVAVLARSALGLSLL